MHKLCIEEFNLIFKSQKSYTQQPEFVIRQ